MTVRETPTKWQVKREASYRALVHSAMHRFHDQGYAATRVEDIVEGTGYSKGAFYFHFENKLDCFWHVVAYREHLRAGWTALPDRHAPESVGLEQLLRETIAGFSESLEGLNAWVLAMVDCYQQTRGEPETRERLRAVYAGWHEELVTFVRALQRGGWVDPGAAPRLLAAQVFAYAEGLTTHAALYGLGDVPFEDALYDGLLKLLAAPRTSTTDS